MELLPYAGLDSRCAVMQILKHVIAPEISVLYWIGDAFRGQRNVPVRSQWYFVCSRENWGYFSAFHEPFYLAWCSPSDLPVELTLKLMCFHWMSLLLFGNTFKVFYLWWKWLLKIDFQRYFSFLWISRIGVQINCIHDLWGFSAALF